MAGGFIDISLLGDKALTKKLRTLEPKVQRRVVVKAFRESAKRIKTAIQSKASGDVVGVDTGRLRKSFKVRAGKRRRSEFSIQVRTGTRDEMGIPAGSKWYYPALIEYGYVRHGIHYPPRSFMRAAMDERRDAELRLLRVGIGKGIEREAKRA